MCKPHRCPHIAMTGNICVFVDSSISFRRTLTLPSLRPPYVLPTSSLRPPNVLPTSFSYSLSRYLFISLHLALPLHFTLSRDTFHPYAFSHFSHFTFLLSRLRPLTLCRGVDIPLTNAYNNFLLPSVIVLEDPIAISNILPNRIQDMRFH